MKSFIHDYQLELVENYFYNHLIFFKKNQQLIDLLDNIVEIEKTENITTTDKKLNKLGVSRLIQEIPFYFEKNHSSFIELEEFFDKTYKGLSFSDKNNNFAKKITLKNFNNKEFLDFNYFNKYPIHIKNYVLKNFATNFTYRPSEIADSTIFSILKGIHSFHGIHFLLIDKYSKINDENIKYKFFQELTRTVFSNNNVAFPRYYNFLVHCENCFKNKNIIKYAINFENLKNFIYLNHHSELSLNFYSDNILDLVKSTFNIDDFLDYLFKNQSYNEKILNHKLFNLESFPENLKEKYNSFLPDVNFFPDFESLNVDKIFLNIKQQAFIKQNIYTIKKDFINSFIGLSDDIKTKIFEKLNHITFNTELEDINISFSVKTKNNNFIDYLIQFSVFTDNIEESSFSNIEQQTNNMIYLFLYNLSKEIYKSILLDNNYFTYSNNFYSNLFKETIKKQRELDLFNNINIKHNITSKVKL